MKNQVTDKPLPSNELAERTILGAILLDHNLLAAAAAKLSPADFYSSKNRPIFEAMLHCRAAGIVPDPITITEQLKLQGMDVVAVGGAAGLANLTYGLPQFATIDQYIAIVKDKSIARQVIYNCNKIIQDAWSEEQTVGNTLSSAATTFIHLQENSSEQDGDDLANVVDDVERTFDAWKTGNASVSALKTGIPELDGYLKFKGLAKGELTMIGARPSTGKTALLLQIATHVIRKKIPVLFVSLEMLKKRLVMRMLPPITGIANKAINPATLKSLPDKADELSKALKQIRELPMYFDRSSELSKLIANAEFFIQNKGVELVVFDYLTLIHGGMISRGETRDAEVGRVVTELKELAVRRDVAVLGAAQMGRKSEETGGKPKISGFRESGVIEHVVDVALFPFDPQAKAHAKDPDAIADGLWLELYCDKQRDGARYWSIDLYFNKNLQTMESEQMRGSPKPVGYKEEGGIRVYDAPQRKIDPDMPTF